jgi:DHA1 family tetracycline resistance protein-like MFS transporter
MAILLLIVFTDLLGFGVVIPLLPFYGLHFGASPAEVTWMMGCYSAAQFFASPLLGRLSDRVGRRPVLLVSLAVSAASYLWLGFADALWMLFFARFLAGAGAGNIAAAQAYITDVTPPETRAKGMGMIGAAFGVGFTIGPPLGGLVAGSDPGTADLARTAFVAAALSAAAFVATLLWLRESLPAEARGASAPSRWQVARDVGRRPVLRQLILLGFVTILAFAGMETTFALWAHDAYGWGPEQVGLNMLVVGLVLVLMQGGLIGPLTRRFGETRLLIAGTGMIALGLVLMPFALVLWRLLVVNLLLAAGMGLFSPAINSLVSQQAASDERGGVLGVFQSASSLSRIIGPAVSGPLFATFGRSAPFFAGAIGMALVVALALRLPRPRHAGPHSEPLPS